MANLRNGRKTVQFSEGMCSVKTKKKNKFKLEIDVLSEIRNDFFIGGG